MSKYLVTITVNAKERRNNMDLYKSIKNNQIIFFELD